jgi:hypothetical protein
MLNAVVQNLRSLIAMLKKLAIAIGIVYVLFSGDYVARGIRNNLKRVGLDLLNSVFGRLSALAS